MKKALLYIAVIIDACSMAMAQQNPAPHLKTQSYGDVSDFAATDAFVAAAIASLQPLSYSLVTPSVRTCPAANCPNPANAHQAPQILASTWVESIASSTVPRQQEWGSIFGMYSNVGQSSDYPTIPPSQKVTVYAGMVQGPLSGPTWTLNTDIVRNGCPTSGAGTIQPYIGSAQPCGTPIPTGIGVSTIGYELDFSNWDQNIDIGGPEVVGMAIVTNSEYRGLAAWYAANGIDGTGTTASWSHGILMTNKTAYDDDYDEIDNVATNGYSCSGNHPSNCFVATGTEGLDAFKDNGKVSNASYESGANAAATPNYGFLASGSYGVAVLDAVGATSNNSNHLKVVRAPPLGDICLDGSNACLFYSSTASLINLTSATGVQNFQFWDNGDFYVLSGEAHLNGGAKVIGGLSSDTMLVTGPAAGGSTVVGDYSETDSVALNGFSSAGAHSGNGFVTTGTEGGDAFKDNGKATRASFESGAATGATPNYGFLASGAYGVAVLDATGVVYSAPTTHVKVVRAAPFGDICFNGSNNCLFYSNTSSLTNLTTSSGGLGWQFWDNGDFHVLSGMSYLSGGAEVVGGLTADKVNCTGVVQQTPASGATIALSSKCLNWINPAAALAALTLTLPTGNTDGDIVKVTFTKAVTAVSLTFPGAINGNITGAAANTTVEFTYIGAPAALWQRTNNPS